MTYINRLIQPRINAILNRGKSILLLGPRQTGKTTVLSHQITADMEYSFIKGDVRRRYEAKPELLIQEIQAFKTLNTNIEQPVVLIGEIQKVPIITDTIQSAIDDGIAKFILTGSSARKLKRNQKKQEINLLPGRVIELRMDALSVLELSEQLPQLDDLLLNGSLPEIILQKNRQDKEELLTSYVNIYLEEEIRAEAIVRNLASFSRFLTYAAVEAGNEINVNNLSEEIGVSRNTTNEYFQILLDCLVAERIEPITDITTQRRLTKSPKYLFFDMGLRRIAAGEGLRLPMRYFGTLFEQFIGIELLKIIRLYAPQAKLRYWHDHAGPEVDYVIEYNRQFIPIEVKYTDKPSKADAKHLFSFIKEFDCVLPAFVVCRTPQAVQISDNVIAVGWQQFFNLINSHFTKPL